MRQLKPGECALMSIFEYAFRETRILHEKANCEVLEGFFSELLSKNISIRSIPESRCDWRERPWDEKADILAEDESGEILLIELQFTQEMDFRQRMYYGPGTTIAERLQRAEYRDVKKVYSINIVYFNLGQGDDYVYHGRTHFTGLHKNDELLLSDTHRKVFEGETAGDVYHEYYIVKINSFDGTVKSPLDQWIYFLKNSAFRDRAKGLDRASEVFDRDNLTPEEQKEYDYILRLRSEDLSAIASSKLEGRMEGREEGREEGRIEREKLAEELANERKEREEWERERAALLAEITRLKQISS